MPTARIIDHRLPAQPSLDSRFSLRTNAAAGGAWWVHCEEGGQWIPADHAHEELVEAVNSLKAQVGARPGGAFSINEHGQVIARSMDVIGPANAVHVVGVTAGGPYEYRAAITFKAGALDPTATPPEGSRWPGPRCGMTYSLTAPGNPQPPARQQDQVFFEEEGRIRQLSEEARINPYPPLVGPLAAFLAALRRQLPIGGRFRVNEHRRAFTSDGNIFIGVVPEPWFPPLTARS